MNLTLKIFKIILIFGNSSAYRDKKIKCERFSVNDLHSVKMVFGTLADQRRCSAPFRAKWSAAL